MCVPPLKGKKVRTGFLQTCQRNRKEKGGVTNICLNALRMHDDSANGLLGIRSLPCLLPRESINSVHAPLSHHHLDPEAFKEHQTGWTVSLGKGKRDEGSSSIEMIFGIPACCLAPHKFEACQNVKASSERNKGSFFFSFLFGENQNQTFSSSFYLVTRGMMQAGHTPNKLLPGRSCSIHFLLPPSWLDSVISDQ